MGLLAFDGSENSGAIWPTWSFEAALDIDFVDFDDFGDSADFFCSRGMTLSINTANSMSVLTGSESFDLVALKL